MTRNLDMIIDGVSLQSTYGLSVITNDKDVPDLKGASSTHTFINGRYIGETDKGNITFEMTMGLYKDGNFSYINADKRDEIDFFLTSKFDLRKVEFTDDDLVGKYFMGKINNLEWLMHGNDVYLLKFTVETNSPYAMKSNITRKYTLTGNTNTITVNNPTHGDRWNDPFITIKMQGAGSDISIKNVTDKNREFTMTGLVGQETITIDCKSGRIHSSTELNKKKNSNLIYPRLAYGNNTFEIKGNIESIEFMFRNEVRIGG